VNVTAEGFSEERFATDILRPHLLQFNIYVHVRKLLTSRKLRKRGGVVGFQKFTNDVLQWIKEDPAAYHTTFIDLYGLTTDFPGFQTTKHLAPYDRVTKIEALIAESIGFHKFIPFIQLHEYESLLFSDPEKMEDYLALYNQFRPGHFQHIVDSCDDNPELINEGPETAPSKRILSKCPVYDKINDGVIILNRIGIDVIRSKCAHFNEWISTLEGLT